MLQITDAIDREFGSALNRVVPLFSWSPRMSWTGALESRVREDAVLNPQLTVSRFPLQRGYHRFPISWLSQAASRQVGRMRRVLRERALEEKTTPLICTTPYWAPVAEKWAGPVVYYLTDLIAEYDGADGKLVRALDRRMCRAATMVCPNSVRLGRYLINETGCDPQLIEVVPNATRACNVLPAPVNMPFPLPADAADLARPVAGVIGNLAGNMDWKLIRETVERTPQFSWLFVGPTDMRIADPELRRAREDVMAMRGRVRFTGHKPYGELRDYARSFDVAVLPYFRREPTLSGSSTRFYEHLAACRPMVATPCFEELLQKEPLLKLVNTAAEAAQRLNELEVMEFEDGYRVERWKASQAGTWEARAAQVVRALTSRVPEIAAGRLASREPAETLLQPETAELRR